MAAEIEPLSAELAERRQGNVVNRYEFRLARLVFSIHLADPPSSLRVTKGIPGTCLEARPQVSRRRSGLPCRASSTPFASIVKCSMGSDLLGCALLEHTRDDRDAAERYHCAPAQNDGADKDDRALSDRA